MIAVPCLDHDRPPARVAREFDGKHRRLGPRVREADLLGTGDARAEQLGEVDLRIRGARPGGTARERLAQRRVDRRIGMAVHQAEPVGEHVEVAVSVDVKDVRAAATLEDDRIRREPRERARDPARHGLARALHQPRRGLRTVQIGPLDCAQLTLGHSDLARSPGTRRSPTGHSAFAYRLIGLQA